MRFLKLFFILFFISSTLLANEKIKEVSLQLLWKHQFEFAGFYMAKEKGFYKDFGLDVSFKEYEIDLDISKEVESGKSEFGIGYSGIILDKLQGRDIKLLNAIYQSSPHVLVSLESSGIQSIKDFQGKRISMTNSHSKTANIKSMIYSHNVTLDEMTKVPYSYDIGQLIDKKVDITSVYLSNEIFQLEKKNIPYKIWDPKDYGFSFYDNILFTSTKLTQEEPELIKNFQKASLMGWEYALNNIDQTVQIILEKYNTQNKSKEALEYEAKELKKLAYYDTATIGKIEESKIQRIIDIYNLIGLVKNKAHIDEFIYNPNSKINLSRIEKEYLENKPFITMCIDPHWMPLEGLQERKHIGLSSDYFEIFKKKLEKDIKVISTTSWDQSLQFAQEGKCEIVSLAMETPKRKEFLNFTTPYLNIPLVIATKNDLNFISDFKTIKGEKLAITRGYAFKEILEKKYPYLTIVEVDNIQQGLEKVKNGEFFGYLGALATIGHMLQTHFQTELKIAGKFDEKWELSVGVQKDDTVLLSIMEKLIQSIDTAQSQELLNKWLAVKYEQTVDYQFLWQILTLVMVIIFLFIYRQYILYRSNQELQKQVELKTKELTQLNKNLEQKVEDAIAQIRQKDNILYEQSKLAAMGEMIGNISHQWRQPLSIISTASSGVKLKIELDMFDKNDDMKALDAITDATVYLSETIDDFRNFLRPDQEQVPFAIQTVFDKILSMFGNNFATNNITIIQNIKDSKVVGNKNELLQVIINILNNSKDAFLETKTKDQRYIFIDSHSLQDHCVINIYDTAGGMDQEILPHIFDPYFTTKHQSVGTGIGLYMSYEIIRNKFGGNILASNTTYTYKNITYTGAKFEIILPLF